jgi:hypothetical protein
MTSPERLTVRISMKAGSGLNWMLKGAGTPVSYAWQAG